MPLDTLTYTKVAINTFDKKVFNEAILIDQKQVTGAVFEIGCLNSQISDLTSGMNSNLTTKADVVSLISNYQAAILVLNT